MSGENKKSNRFFLHKNRLQTCINNLQIVLTQQIYEKKQSVVAGLERFRWLATSKLKCVLFFMLTLVCGVQGKVYSQQYTLDLHLKQTSLEEVFNRIEAQTGLKFLYNTLLTDSKGKVDVEARQEDIRKVLDELLNPLGLTYILNSNHIVVKQADAAAPQEKTVIKGKVTDSKGSPLPGVTVRIKGTNIGVVSDNDGHYELTLPAGTDPTLIFSFVGMLSQEAKYTGQRELNIILHENIGGLFHGFLCAALPRHTP
mgnify:CR=1 FL=1